MDNKLEQLTQKLYEEGLTKGRSEGDKMIAEAEAKDKKIITCLGLPPPPPKTPYTNGGGNGGKKGGRRFLNWWGQLLVSLIIGVAVALVVEMILSKIPSIIEEITAIRVVDIHPAEPEMVYIEGGTFWMGSSAEGAESDEAPIYQVTLSSYCIGKYEITQAQWKAIMGSNPSKFKGNNLPVENISWYDAQEFITRLNSATGKNYDLPTEAEWEFAARGGNKSQSYTYSGSNNIDEVAWYDSNSGEETHPVGTKMSNELGIYDMSGNVLEWCSDWYDTYPSSAWTDPYSPSTGLYRVLRGGSWYSNAQYCRSANRDNDFYGDRYSNIGFRLVLLP
jgi:hypothetical protein